MKTVLILICGLLAGSGCALSGGVQTANRKLSETKAGKELGEKIQLWFDASDLDLVKIKFTDAEDELLNGCEQEIRQMAWDAYRNGRLARSLRSDYQNSQVKNNGYVSPYFVKQVGEKPADGWPLFIAMHGGGGVAKKFNDRQWNNMKGYYRNQTGSGGYLYVALRAPTDAWNGFYTSYIYPLIDNLIRQFMIYEDINPNKVFAMGYSHGGYGAFAIGPTMADRFAAVHASAAAPTGQSAALNLRNTRFTYMVGEKDTAYGRVDRCRNFSKTIEQLRDGRDDIYPVVFELKKGFGHGGLPDRDKIAEMIKYRRTPLPKTIAWQMTVGNVHNFYWLRVPGAGGSQKITANCSDNTIVLNSENVKEVHILLDNRLVDPGKPVTVKANNTVTVTDVQLHIETLLETLLQRGDPEFAFTSQIIIDLQ